MKELIKQRDFKGAYLLLTLCIMQLATYAQDNAAPATSSGTRETTVKVTTESADWVSQPWVWVVGAAVVILILVALLRGRSSSGTATRTDRVTVTKTSSSDTDVV